MKLSIYKEEMGVDLHFRSLSQKLTGQWLAPVIFRQQLQQKNIIGLQFLVLRCKIEAAVIPLHTCRKNIKNPKASLCFSCISYFPFYTANPERCCYQYNHQ